jgi:hypothetical protein
MLRASCLIATNRLTDYLDETFVAREDMCGFFAKGASMVKKRKIDHPIVVNMDVCRKCIQFLAAWQPS